MKRKQIGWCEQNSLLRNFDFSPIWLSLSPYYKYRLWQNLQFDGNFIYQKNHIKFRLFKDKERLNN